MAAVTAAILASAAAGAFGAAKASSAAKSAAKEQSKTATASAADIRQERNRYAERFMPYAQASDASLGRLSDSLLRNNGRPTRTPMGMPYGSAGGSGMPIGQSLQQATGQMWAVRSPDGETRMVPAQVGQRLVGERGGMRVG